MKKRETISLHIQNWTLLAAQWSSRGIVMIHWQASHVCLLLSLLGDLGYDDQIHSNGILDLDRMWWSQKHFQLELWTLTIQKFVTEKMTSKDPILHQQPGTRFCVEYPTQYWRMPPTVNKYWWSSQKPTVTQIEHTLTIKISSGCRKHSKTLQKWFSWKETKEIKIDLKLAAQQITHLPLFVFVCFIKQCWFLTLERVCRVLSDGRQMNTLQITTESGWEVIWTKPKEEQFFLVKPSLNVIVFLL